MFTANMYTPLDREMVLLQLCRWKFSHKKKLCSRLHDSIELEFYSQKRQIRFSSHPLGKSGVTYALHLLLVGKRVVKFLFAVIEHFFASSYGSDVISRYWSKSSCFKGGGSLKCKFQGKEDIAHQLRLLSEN